MAISTLTIQDTMNWAKQLSWNRNSGIGNSLEPALSSANMVMQTILGPPFTWWWNNKEISFTCNTTLETSTITHVAIAGGIATITTTNAWVENNQLMASGLATFTELNGQLLTVLTASGSQITAAVNLPDHAGANDSGTLTDTTTQDYTVNIPNFSHIEHASLYDISKTPSQWRELTVKNNLALDSNAERPDFINPHIEDANGNVTFRVMPAPNKAYPVSIHCQLSAPQITSLNQTWGPIPDYMQYVYNWGFMALVWAFADDQRQGYANQKFTAGLLARAQGLTEEERNIFLNNWNDLTMQQKMQNQQGTQARGI
jgi:hypothetical protein